MALIICAFMLIALSINMIFFKELVKMQNLIWIVMGVILISAVLILLRPEYTTIIGLVARCICSITICYTVYGMFKEDLCNEPIEY